MRAVAAVLVAAACGHAPPPSSTSTSTSTTSAPADAPGPSQEAELAAIQKAMNDLSPAIQQCWAVAAAVRFDVEGQITAQIEVGSPRSRVTLVGDTAHNEALGRCLIDLLGAWQWAPPLTGRTIQLPFQFHAPDGQSVVDRRLVPWQGQGKLSVAVLLDEDNTGNAGASMLEIALAAGGSTDMRVADRAELWYFLGPASVAWTGGGRLVTAGDMLYAPPGSVRDVSAAAAVHAVVVIAPGGREGTARAGALANREVAQTRPAPPAPIVLPASAAKTYGPATIYAEDATIHARTLAASILQLPAGARVPEHVHANETELVYMLDGAGTMTVAGTDVPITSTSVIQIPPNVKHALVVSAALRAVQIYVPGGPEQRFKK